MANPTETAAAPGRIVTIAVDQLPEQLRFTEAEQDLYQEFLDVDVEESFSLKRALSGEYVYRAKDRPTFKIESKIGAGKINAVVQVNSSFHLASGESRHLGWPSHDISPNVANPHCVQVRFDTGTQRPSTTIFIDVGKGRPVGYKMPAASLVYSSTTIGLLFYAGADRRVSRNLPDHRKVKALASDNKLWRADFNLIPIDDAHDKDRPQWTDITLHEFASLRRRFDAKLPLTPAEELVVNLDNANRISLFVNMGDDAAEDLAPVFQHVRAITFAAAHLGNHWWFRLACSDRSLQLPCHALHQMPIPRWLVTKWLVTFENETARQAVPIEWKSSSLVDLGLNADQQTHYLERWFQRRQDTQKTDGKLENMREWLKVGIHVRLAAYVDNQYIAMFTFAEADRAGLRCILPKIGTPMDIAVTVEGYTLRLAGNLTGDFPGSKANFCATVGTLAQGVPRIEDRDEDYLATILFDV